jgi:hypothetical protein
VVDSIVIEEDICFEAYFAEVSWDYSVIKADWIGFSSEVRLVVVPLTMSKSALY